MKILHTADWHIGKSLYKHALYEDIQLFFSELISIIDEEAVDVLLVSGDIFDLANPSNKDKEVYYSFLTTLISKNIQVVITAGNHDSVRMLEAPKALLKQLNVHIVGNGLDLESQIIPFSKGSVHINVLAVPYLKDRDIRKSRSGESYDDAVTALREGIKNHYEKLVQIAKKGKECNYIIGMGHLYVQGSSLSDSEREIQIGNLAGVQATELDTGMDYLALGHIHRPQVLTQDGRIQYSGSPIALSFSERKDEKRVVLIDLSDSSVTINHRSLTKYRMLSRLSGTVDEIKTQLNSFENTSPLPAMIELNVHEQNRDESKLLELIEIANSKDERYFIVNYKIHFEEQIEQLHNLKSDQIIQDLKPMDVFESRLGDSIEKDKKEALTIAFNELLEEWTQNHNE